MLAAGEFPRPVQADAQKAGIVLRRHGGGSSQLFSQKSSQHRFGFFQHAAPVHFHRQKPCKGISGFGRIHPFHLLVHGGCHLRQLCIGTVP